MGLLSLLITIGIMALGIGYYYFAVPQTPKTFVNDNEFVTAGVPLYQDLKGQANGIKELAESRAKEQMAVLEEGISEEPIPASARPESQMSESQPSNGMVGIVNRLMTTGFSVSKQSRNIDTIVLHSSYNPNGEAYSVEELVKIYESYKVSAHYLIDRSGKIYRLVEDKNIAYHAGASKMPDGRQDVNNFSLGIEIMNKEDTEFTKAQYEAVRTLVTHLKKQYGIKYVVGHSTIAPERKTDPWNFDWKRLE